MALKQVDSPPAAEAGPNAGGSAGTFGPKTGSPFSGSTNAGGAGGGGGGIPFYLPEAAGPEAGFVIPDFTVPFGYEGLAGTVSPALAASGSSGLLSRLGGWSSLAKLLAGGVGAVGAAGQTGARTSTSTTTTTPHLYWPGATSGGSGDVNWWDRTKSQDWWSGKGHTEQDLGAFLSANPGKSVKDWLGGFGLTPGYDSEHFYQLGEMGQGGGQQLAGDLPGLIDSLMAQYNSPGHGVSIPGGTVSASHMSASHYSPQHAMASLIDILDPAYEENPNADLREDVYSRLLSGSRANANDINRRILDAARLSGAGPNAPWVQALTSKSDREGAKNATQGLTDFFDSFVRAALERRAGALAQNSATETNANEFNAGADNAAGQFNAASSNQANAFNASADNSASAANAQLNQMGGYYSSMLGNQNLADIIRLMEFTHTPQQVGGTSTTTTEAAGQEGSNYGFNVLGPLIQSLI